MKYLESMKQLRSFTAQTGPKIILPLEAVSVKGSRAIYCPHCGYMFTDTPVSKYGIYRCRSCHGDFYLYSRNASDKKRRGVLV